MNPIVILVLIIFVLIFLKWLFGKEKKSQRKLILSRVRRNVYQRCNGRCVWCKKPIEYKDAQMDHIIPFSKGGTDDENNLQVKIGRAHV